MCPDKMSRLKNIGIHLQKKPQTESQDEMQESQ